MCVCELCVCFFPCASDYSCLSPPVGSCPVSRPYCSSHSKRSPRSISACPWRMKSCSGSCKTATCSRVPVASLPPPPSAHLGTRPAFRPPLHCPPDNLHLASSTFWLRPNKDGAVPKTWITAALLDFAHEYYKSFGIAALEHSHALYLFSILKRSKTTRTPQDLYIEYCFILALQVFILLSILTRFGVPLS